MTQSNEMRPMKDFGMLNVEVFFGYLFNLFGNLNPLSYLIIFIFISLLVDISF